MTGQQVSSPCVSICALNEDDICIGCYRTDQEIMRWRDMNSQQRQQTLILADQRACDLGRLSGN